MSDNSDSQKTQLSNEELIEERARIENQRFIAEDKARLQFKRSSFDTQFRKLVSQLLEIIKERHGDDVIRGETVLLNKYMTIYEKTTPEEHYQYFENLFNRNRQKILDSLNDDKWLRKGKQVIQFGEGLTMSESLRKIRIPLSDIYNMACELRKNAENILDGLESTGENISTDVIRPSIIQLHLMRIFYHLIDTEDKREIGQILTSLENELQCKVHTVGHEPWRIAPQRTQSSSSSSSSGGLSKLFPLAISMMEKFGVKAPEGMIPPFEDDISNVITTVFESQGAQSMVQGLIGSLNGCTDLGTAIKTVVNTVGDQNSIGIIEESIKNTRNIANESLTRI